MTIEGIGAVFVFRLLQGVFYSTATIIILFIVNRVLTAFNKKPITYKWWIFPLQTLSIAILFMFFTKRDDTIGDYGLRLPIGYNYELQHKNEQTYIALNGKKLLHPSGRGYETVDSFVIDGRYFGGKSKIDFILFNLETGEKTYTQVSTNPAPYNTMAIENHVKTADSFTDFYTAYNLYRPIWKQYLLP